MEIKVLKQTSRRILTFSHLAFTVCRYTLVQRNRNTQSCIHTHHIKHIHRARQQSFKYFIYIQFKASIYSTCNLSLWLLIPMCVCVPKCELSFFVYHLVLHFYLMFESWNFVVPLYKCGYVFGLQSWWTDSSQSWQTTTSRAALLAQQPAHPIPGLYFFIWQPNTINYSTW